MKLHWCDAQYRPIHDALEDSPLGRWISERAATVRRNSGLDGSLMIVMENPDKLVLWFKNEKGTHNTVPKFILERTQFEIDSYGQEVRKELEKHFARIEQT